MTEDDFIIESDDLVFHDRVKWFYWNKPVIAPRTKGIMDYFGEDSIYFFEAGKADSLAKTILDVYRDSLRRQFILEKGVKVYNEHRWESEGKHFVELVTNLLGID
jgi:glycosyltransferase involved in cell wall biosynthesis